MSSNPDSFLKKKMFLCVGNYFYVKETHNYMYLAANTIWTYVVPGTPQKQIELKIFAVIEYILKYLSLILL